MNALQWLSGPLAHAIGWALLHLLWQGVVVAAILAAALALLSKRTANVRYAVSCSALALLLVLGVITAVRAYEPPPAMSDPNITALPVTNPTAVLATVAAVALKESATDVVLSAREWLPIIVTVWLSGVIFLSLRLLLSWMRAQRLVRHGAAPASEEWEAIAARLSASLGLTRAVRLLESAAVEVPSVIGSLRPVILLPVATLTGMTPQQLEMVLAHELAHIRRHDFFVNLLQALVETLMFYHPAVWWISRRVRIERENCCDDLAVAVCGNPLQYARALTRLEELRAEAMPIAVAANGGSLLDRIRRIAGARAESTTTTSRWAAAIAVLTVVALLIIVPSFPALAQREDKAKAAKEAKEAKSEVDVRAEKERDRQIEASRADADDDDDDDFDVDVDTPEPPETPAVAVSVTTPRPPMAPHLAGVPPVPGTPVAVASLDMNRDDDDDDDDDQDDRAAAAREEARRKEGKLTVEELVRLAASGITPEYIADMRTLFPNAPIKDLAELRTFGVDKAYINAMRATGIQVDSAKDYGRMAAVGVTPEFVKQMRAAGVNVDNARDAQKLSAVGVTPVFVKQLADAGYKDLSVHELTRLAAVGVDGDFIREMSKYRNK